MIELDEHDIKASTFVTRWVEHHVKSRVLDGRPDRVFIQTLTRDLAEFLRMTAPKQQETASGRRNKRQIAGD
jgi:hypothetical protein